MDTRPHSQQVKTQELSKLADIFPAEHHIQLATQYLNLSTTEAKNIKSDNHGKSHDTTLAYFERYVNQMSNITENVRGHFISLLDKISLEQCWFPRTDYIFLRENAGRTCSVNQPLMPEASQIELGKSEQFQSNDTFNDNNATELKTRYSPHDYQCKGPNETRKVISKCVGHHEPTKYAETSFVSNDSNLCHICGYFPQGISHNIHYIPVPECQTAQNAICHAGTSSIYHCCSKKYTQQIDPGVCQGAPNNHRIQSHEPKITYFQSMGPIERETASMYRANTYPPTRGARPRTRIISFNDACVSTESSIQAKYAQADKSTISGQNAHIKPNTHHSPMYGAHKSERSQTHPSSLKSCSVHIEGRSLQVGEPGLCLGATNNHHSQSHGQPIIYSQQMTPTVRESAVVYSANTYPLARGGTPPRTTHISLNNAPGSTEKATQGRSVQQNTSSTSGQNEPINSNLIDHSQEDCAHNSERSRPHPPSSQSLPSHLEGRSLQEGKLGIKIFITYSWDSKGHVVHILDLADWLRRCGYHVCIDMADKLAMAIDIHGWIEEKFTRADYILVICSPRYLRDTGLVSEPSELEYHGLHTRYIHRLMQTKYTSNACKNYRFTPIVLENSGGTRAQVPQWLHNTNIYKYPSEAKDLYFRLRVKRTLAQNIGTWQNFHEE